MSGIANGGEKKGIPNSCYWDLREEDEDEAYSSAMSLLTDVIKRGVLKAVMELDVLEMIKKSGKGGCLSAAEIAARLPTKNPEAAADLGRMLDFLVTHSILTLAPNTVPRRYGLAPVCKFLTANQDGVSLAPFNNTLMFKAIIDSALCLKDAILEGVQPFRKAHGMSLYEFSGKNPEHLKEFQRAMSHHSTLIMQKVLTKYKGFEGVKSLVDVGGGKGTILSMILSRYHAIKGINFDLPHVVADAPPYPGMEHQGGDMFVSIPKGDAMFIKWILHNYNDEACITILKNCYNALPDDGGKVIICEHVLVEANETANNVAEKSVFQFDMIMMISPGGKERSEKEYKALAMAAGFKNLEIVCSAFNAKIIELTK